MKAFAGDTIEVAKKSNLKGRKHCRKRLFKSWGCVGNGECIISAQNKEYQLGVTESCTKYKQTWRGLKQKRENMTALHT